MLTPCRLAAVDLHTAAHLVKRAFSGDLARNRTIILVTHHINLCLPIAAHLVELSSGVVLRNGSTADLRERNELEKLVEAEDTVTEESTETSSATTTDVEHELDLGKSRAPSIHSNDKGKGRSTPLGDNAKAGKLIDEENRAEGRVSLRTYWTYIRAAGVICWILTFALMLMLRFINIGFQVSVVNIVVSVSMLSKTIRSSSWPDGAKRTRKVVQ